MAFAYSVDLCKRLERKFRGLALRRPFSVDRYDAGDRLEYDITPVEARGEPCRVKLEIEKFVGGGFAGQVYKVRILESKGTLAEEVPVGGSFALKILIPPSAGAELFRNLLYFVGFQGQFQPQTNPTAARAGAIWQKLIRRAAGIRFGSESCVNDVHGTFVDHRLGSCGELSDWIDGRVWRLEVDDRVDLLKQWRRGKVVDENALGSPEYRSKKRFMTSFVRLLNDIGAPEFARQYEWSTCKSQPNCLKRTAAEADPEAGLTAVDFRAGLALLPFLPMSPGDFLLILKGLARGSLVQFDRGDLDQLERFMSDNGMRFADMRDLFAELRELEEVYRNSLIDITHNHVRLLFSGALWKQIMQSAVTGWRVRTLVDSGGEDALRGRALPTALFALLGLLPFIGRPLRRLWGRADYRSHYRSMLTSFGYLRRAVAGKMAERTISWHRAGRITEDKAEKVASSSPAFAHHLLVSLLPAGIHRLLTDISCLKELIYNIAVRPVRLYFNAAMREEWLREMVKEGERKRIVTEADAQLILSRIDEPYIQKYLKSLAVHVCTAPVTQVVSLIVAAIYIMTHPELPRAQAYGMAVGIVALFQVVPISPGSLARGLYVVYLVIRERNFKDYNIALFLGFFKYVGYLAFPIQMTYRYPTMARFMAAYWATNAVHIVPVFGENGALLEHKVFTLFYNVPLTLRGRMRRRAELREALPARRWHLLPVAVVGAAVLAATAYLLSRSLGQMPELSDIWWCMLLTPLICGSLFTLLAGGVAFGGRVVGAVFCGIATGLLFAVATYGLTGWEMPLGQFAAGAVWRLFIAGVLAPIGAIVTEICLPEP
jgi:hypothetical protein